MVKILQKISPFFVGESRLSEYISPERLTELTTDKEKENQIEKKLEELTKRAKEFSSNERFWTKLLALIEQVRLAVAEKRWIPAQQSLIEATVLVNRAIGSEALRRVRIWLALSPVGWFILLYALQRFMLWLGKLSSSFYLIAPEYFQYLWLGMLGGTTIVLWGIVKHSTEMNFDRVYIVWYLLKPALGAIMAVLVVLIIKAGFLTLQGSTNIEDTTPLLVLAFICGFSERFFIGVIDKVITSVLGGETSPPPQSPPVRSVRVAPQSSTRPPKRKTESKKD